MPDFTDLKAFSDSQSWVSVTIQPRSRTREEAIALMNDLEFTENQVKETGWISHVSGNFELIIFFTEEEK